VAVPLTLGASTVATVFDLLGSAENDLTYALGWALARSDGLAGALMAEVFPDGPGEVLAVALQRYGPDGGYTDVEIAATKAHLILEAKKGWMVPDDVQLSRYSIRPARITEACLLSVSAAARTWALRRLPAKVGGVRVEHRSWGDLAHLADSASRSGSHESRRLLREVASYLKGVSRMQNVSSNWAYCVVLGRKQPTGFKVSLVDLPLVHRKYAHPYDASWTRVPPTYVAFRWNGCVRQFNHVDEATVVDDLADGLPGLVAPGVVTRPHAVYTLGPPIELPKPLPNGRIYATARVLGDDRSALHGSGPKGGDRHLAGQTPRRGRGTRAGVTRRGVTGMGLRGHWAPRSPSRNAVPVGPSPAKPPPVRLGQPLGRR
jgi:hypothetical protein